MHRLYPFFHVHVYEKKSEHGSTCGFMSLRISAATIVQSRVVQMPYFFKKNKRYSPTTVAMNSDQ